MNEADEEHHVAKILIAELEEINGRETHYAAKFTVLAENVRHLIAGRHGTYSNFRSSLGRRGTGVQCCADTALAGALR